MSLRRVRVTGGGGKTATAIKVAVQAEAVWERVKRGGW